MTRNMTVFCLLLLLTVAFAKHEEYERWKSYVVTPHSNEDLRYLRSLDIEYSLDYLGHPTVNGDGLVLVKPEHQQGFQKILHERKISYMIHSDNVASALRVDDKDIEIRARTLGRSSVSMPYDNYQRLGLINNYLEDIAKRYSDRATLVTAGFSYQRRPIKYLKVSTSNFTDPKKSIIFIEGGMHAREWISPPTVTWAIHKLLENVTEPDLLDNFDFILLPVANPDGYEYTHTNSRWWRKTMSPSPSLLQFWCRGADGNRNYGFYWNTTGVDQDPCSEIYPGNSPFSEAETRAIKDLVDEHLSRMVMYISMHSYGSMILYPWGHDGSQTENVHDLHAVGVAMGEAIDRDTLPLFDKYSVGNILDVVGYEASGASTDYVYSVGVPLSYTIELPGLRSGVQGFNLPPRYIQRVCRDTWSGIVAGAKKILRLSIRSKTMNN